jgi:hypothetical protein
MKAGFGFGGKVIALVAALAALVAGGLVWRGMDRFEALFTENTKLKQSLENLLTEDTLGQLYLEEQTTGPSGTVTSTISWLETAAPEHERAARLDRFRVSGRTVYLDGFLIRFPSAMVADGEARALYFWRRAFGNSQTPDSGHLLDDGQGAPARYQPIFGETFSAQRGELFWSALWDLAHDPDKLEQFGIETVFGNALAIEPRPGFLYTIKLSASGALLVEIAPLTVGTQSTRS